METPNFYTRSLQDVRIARILAAALDAVEPGRVVKSYLLNHPLPIGQRIFAVAVGKAALPMLEALSGSINLEGALMITKHATPSDSSRLKKKIPGISIMQSGHPLPDERSLAAGSAALAFVSGLEAQDMLVCLISGGGSALMTAPLVPLDEMQALTSALLACGARIEETNTLRRHLDRVKGGGLAQATRARVLSLILSDVVGNPLEAIASGPTVPDPTTRKDALGVLEKYFPASLPAAAPKAPGGWFARKGKVRRGNLIAAGYLKVLSFARKDIKIPASILQALSSNPETPKAVNHIFSRVKNVIVGDNTLAVQAALSQAHKEGFHAMSLGSTWQGEARQVGRTLVDKLRVVTKEREAPFCLIAGGETTVTLQGDGLGGRNQELALAAVTPLAGLEHVMLISLASDGEDGPSDAAGAVVTGETLQRANRLRLDPAGYLARNDSYHFFDQLRDLIRTGPTGTNVNDLAFLIRK